MTGKKIFNEIAAAILKFGIVVLLSCGLTSCASLQNQFSGHGGYNASNPVELEPVAIPDPTPVEIVYKEINYSELENAIANVNTTGHGFIVKTRITVTYSSPCAFDIVRGEEKNSLWVLHINTHGVGGSLVYVDPPQFEMYDTEYMDKIWPFIDKEKQYQIFIGVYYSRNDSTYKPFIDKVEELPTKEELPAFLETHEKMEAAAKEAKFNPNKLDRSQYKKIKAEDFSFDMATENLPAGSKVAFEAMFLIKPTGTKYIFNDINIGITLSSNHNFVRDIPSWYFEWPKRSVTVYVTVKKSGQYGECLVDIIDWKTER